MDNQYPDSPEAVALSLLEKILEREDPLQKRNEPQAAWMLDLYAQCLAAARGDRQKDNVLNLVRH